FQRIGEGRAFIGSRGGENVSDRPTKQIVIVEWQHNVGKKNASTLTLNYHLGFGGGDTARRCDQSCLILYKNLARLRSLTSHLPLRLSVLLVIERPRGDGEGGAGSDRIGRRARRGDRAAARSILFERRFENRLPFKH